MSNIPPSNEPAVPPTYASYPRGYGSDVGGPGNNALPTRPPAPYWDYISIAFTMIFKNATVFIVGSLIALMATQVIQLPVQLIMQPLIIKNGAINWLMLVGMYVLMIPAVVLQMVLYAGISNAAIEQADTGNAKMESVFAGFKCTLPIIGVSLVTSMLYLVATLACLVPLVAALGLLSYAPLICIRERTGAMASIARSIELAKSNMWMLGFLFIVAALVSSLGAIACCIGIFVTMPVFYIVVALHYRDASRAGDLAGGMESMGQPASR